MIGLIVVTGSGLCLNVLFDSGKLAAKRLQ
jgi:hypothetical protein